MDSVTQAALGACIALAGWRELGLRGLAFGAACGLLPDADVVLGWGEDAAWDRLLTHRGSSHSLLVLPWVALPMGWLGHRLVGRVSLGGWVHLAFWALITHPLLDVCTSYGTQLLAPLSRQRFSLDCVAILDPVATLPLLVALLARRSGAARAALGWLGLYLLLGLGVTVLARGQAHQRLRAEGFEPVALRATVPILFTPLRRISARDEGGALRVGMHAVWAPERTELLSLPAPEGVDELLRSERGQRFAWFADGYLHRVDDERGTWLLDQRYGLFSDPTWTPFRALLPAGAAIEELQLVHERGRVDGAAELDAGLRLIFGPTSRSR